MLPIYVISSWWSSNGKFADEIEREDLEIIYFLKGKISVSSLLIIVPSACVLLGVMMIQVILPFISGNLFLWIDEGKGVAGE